MDHSCQNMRFQFCFSLTAQKQAHGIKMKYLVTINATFILIRSPLDNTKLWPSDVKYQLYLWFVDWGVVCICGLFLSLVHLEQFPKSARLMITPFQPWYNLADKPKAQEYSLWLPLKIRTIHELEPDCSAKLPSDVGVITQTKILWIQKVLISIDTQTPKM